MTLTIHDDIDQRSQAWFDLRVGCITASVVGQLVTMKAPDALEVACECGAGIGIPCINKRNGQPMTSLHPARIAAAKSMPRVLTIADMQTDALRLLAARLAAERVTGIIDPDEELGGRDIWRGLDSEDPAREKYAEHYDVVVTNCGFMERGGDGYRLGYSPDGLVGDDGLIEIKAPRQKGHLLTAVDGEVPERHMAQIQTGLFVSGRAWCDFVSFHGGMRLWVLRVLPDPAWFKAIDAASTEFQKLIAQMVKDYYTATDGFPIADRLPDYHEVDLKL